MCLTDDGLTDGYTESHNYTTAVLLYKKIGNLQCCALGANITPPPLFLIFRFFLILAPAGGSNPAGP